jgi:hypothetical protein
MTQAEILEEKAEAEMKKKSQLVDAYLKEHYTPQAIELITEEMLKSDEKIYELIEEMKAKQTPEERIRYKLEYKKSEKIMNNFLDNLPG